MPRPPPAAPIPSSSLATAATEPEASAVTFGLGVSGFHFEQLYRSNANISGMKELGNSPPQVVSISRCSSLASHLAGK